VELKKEKRNEINNRFKSDIRNDGKNSFKNNTSPVDSNDKKEIGGNKSSSKKVADSPFLVGDRVLVNSR
jgi:hypothetical protein